MKVRPRISYAGLFALVLCGAPTLVRAAYTAQNAPDRTTDGYPIVWLGNAEQPGSPTSDRDAVPDAFKRVRTSNDSYIRFAKGTDKRAYGCYAGGAPEVTATPMIEVRGREEGEGPKTTFKVQGWLVVCKKTLSTVGAPSLSSQPAPAP